MGFLDDISATFNKGADVAGRTAKTLKLKGQLAEVNRRRQSLAAQLGASLYDATKDDPAFREGREDLYDSIAACDEERAGYQAEIERIEAEAAAAAEAANILECTNCHAKVSASDRFCSGCGTPVAEIKEKLHEMAEAAEAAATGATCSKCGASVGEGDVFCTACGARIDDIPAAEIVSVESVERVEAPQTDTAEPSDAAADESSAAETEDEASEPTDARA